VMLADEDPAQLDPKLVNNVLGFFRNLELPYAARENRKLWTKTTVAVEKLRTLPGVQQNPAATAVLPVRN
jgi:hypothetical protein